MKKLAIVWILSIAAILFARANDDQEATAPPSSIVFSRSLQILMPKDLCDNYQSTLQYYVKTYLEVSQAGTLENRQTWQGYIDRLRQDMKDTGCG